MSEKTLSTAQDDKKSFRHESLQDTQSIQSILKALTKGIGKGRLRFSDESGEIIMEPKGLLDLKLTASREEGRHRVMLRITWQEDEEKPHKALKVD